MHTIRVGVTGINAIDNPGPGIGVIRSLKEDKSLDVEAVGLAYDAMDPGIYMDWLVDKAFMIPYPSGTGEDFLSRLIHLNQRIPFDMLIPTLDSELLLFIKVASKLKSAGIRTFLPTREQFELRDKRRLVEVAEKLGLRIPELRTVSSHNELREALGELAPPVMIKGVYYKAYRADTFQAAFDCFDSIVAEWGYPVIVQKVVSGDEMNVVGLGDGEGQNLGMVGIKKLMITNLGKIWTGVTIKNDSMLKAAGDFIEEYKWKGGFELECILSGDDVYLIEINPRFPAWVYFSTGVGINLPARMVRAAMDLPVEKNLEYQAGKMYVRYTYDIVTDMSAFQSIMTKAERL